METLWHDLRHAWRVLRRRPGLLAAAVLTLGLGTGANTALFSVVNGVLFRPPAVADPGRLVWITLRPPYDSRPLNLSWPDYDDLQQRPDLFSGLAAYDAVPLALSGGGEPERVRGQIVGGAYFSVLGVRAQRGRVLLAADDRTEGAHPVAVLSDSLWRRRFGADPSLIGRTLTINGHRFEVVGIAPPGFSGTEVGEDCDVFLPLAMHREASPGPGSERRAVEREASWLRVVARLRDGVTLARARAALPAPPRPAPGVSVVLTPFSGALHPANRGDVLPIFAVLLLVAGAVLLIACANVGNLLLARAAERRRELAVRLALGATRGRVIRQILTESTLVAGLGALAGLLFAWWGVPVLLRFAEAPADLGHAAEPDLRVLLFTLVTALGAGLLCGIAPSLGVIRGDPTPGLKGDGAGLAPRARRTQSALVVSQMALSLLLLLGTGLLLRSLGKAMRVDPGFDARDAVALSFDLALQGYPEEKRMAFCRDLLERLSALPGVRSASLAALLPLSGRMAGMEAAPEEAAPDGGAPARTSDGPSFTFVNVVWPDYFHTLGTALLRGRDFRDADRRGAPAVAIVNETLARRFWPGEDPLGRRARLDEGNVVEVVGLARDGKYDELSEDPQPLVYLPYAQRPALLPGLTLVVRAAGDTGGTLAAARRMARELDPELPLVDATSLEGLVRQRSDKQRSVSALLAFLGALALVLAGLGLYGVISFTVARRTREIGVRLALGARPRQVVRLFLWQGVRLALLGVGVGLGPAIVLMTLLSKVLFGIGASDLTTFAGVALLLVAAATAACFVPARRAASLQPGAALRLE